MPGYFLCKVSKKSPYKPELLFISHQQSASDAAYISRHVALKANVPVTTPALTVNRLCGSGFQAVVTAAQEIQLGESDVVLCGGSENMSQAPYALRDARFGTKLGLDLKVRSFLLLFS